MLFFWLVKPCFCSLIDLSASHETAGCLWRGNNRLNYSSLPDKLTAFYFEQQTHISY